MHANGIRQASELAEGLDAAATSGFLSRMTELGLLERAPAPLAEARAFPQEVELAPSPEAPEAPEIRATEPVETIAGATCGAADIVSCSVLLEG